MQSERFVARRRLALGVIAVLIVVPVYMLFIRDDDDPPPEPAVREAVNDPNKAAEILLDQAGDPQQGITVRFPDGWSSANENQVVRAKSADGRTVIAVTTGGPAAQAPKLFTKAVKGVSSSYTKPKVALIPSKEQPPIGGLPAAGAIVSGQLKGGGPGTTFVYVSRGSRRAYVVSALVPSDGGDLPTANLILTRGLTLSG